MHRPGHGRVLPLLRCLGSRRHQDGSPGHVNDPRSGTGFIHSASDDRTRICTCEILDDERTVTAAGFRLTDIAWPDRDAAALGVQDLIQPSRFRSIISPPKLLVLSLTRSCCQTPSHRPHHQRRPPSPGNNTRPPASTQKTDPQKEYGFQRNRSQRDIFQPCRTLRSMISV